MPTSTTAVSITETDIHTHSKNNMQAKEDNLIQQAWHSIEEALHLREPSPPPVPPKDEKWLIKTVNMALPQEEEEEPDSNFWNKIVQRISNLHLHSTLISEANEDDEEAVSINVPADAALRQLGIQADDTELQDKLNYFKRMAVRCKEKFDEDNSQSADNATSTLLVLEAETEAEDTQTTQDLVTHHHVHHHRRRHQVRRYFHELHQHFRAHETEKQLGHAMSRAQFVPKVDPQEAKAAHKIIYRHHRQGAAAAQNGHEDKDEEDDDDDEEDRKLFGSWWGWHHSRHTKSEKQLEKQLDSEWEKIDLPTNKEEKRQSLGERNGALHVDLQTRFVSERKWWKHQPQKDISVVALSSKSGPQHDRRNAAKKRHQAIAAAAAYEAVKEYNARKTREGKSVKHGEMKAILAGIAMAEAIKLLESRHSESDDDNDTRNDTVAEAGSTALKLFELLR